MLAPRIPLFLLILLCLLGTAGMALSADRQRIALVIGNSHYRHTSPLENPTRDADLIATILRNRNFDVALHKDLDLKAMRRAVGALARSARTSGRETVVFFYYAGHGVQVGKRNFLIPVDAKIDYEGDVPIEAFNVDSLMESLADAEAIVNIVVLDACRNNPYKTSFRSTSAGLARIDGPPGFLIAFSTDPGRVAQDGPEGANSPYTKALSEALSIDGVKIEEAFKETRRKVFRETGGFQVPWETSSLLADLYMKEMTTSAGISGVQASLDNARAKALADSAAAELAKAEAARHAATTERERAEAEAAKAKAEAARAAAELERIKTETALARAQAENELNRARTQLEAARERDINNRSAPSSPMAFFDSRSLYSAYAVPSFNCGEYAVKPIGHPDRNPQTDILCIEPSAAAVDSQLGEVFRATLRSLSGSQRRSAVALQKQWILQRNGACPAEWNELSSADRRASIAACLVRETVSRIQALKN